MHLYLKKSAFAESSHRWGKEDVGTTLSRLLFAWYDVAPFSLASLTTMPAAKQTLRHYLECRAGVVRLVTPSSTILKTPSLSDDINPREDSAIATHNDLATKRREIQHTFISSTGSNDGGGTCVNEASFANTLKRFFSETLSEDAVRVIKSLKHTDSFSWLAKTHCGLSRHHRTAWTSANFDDPTCSMAYNFSGFANYLQDDDHCTLVQNLAASANSVFHRTQNFIGLMQQLENLGHSPSPQPDGLKGK